MNRIEPPVKDDLQGPQPFAPPECDVCLLLRVHAEQSWLQREVIPVIDNLSAHEDLDPAQRIAALAYLEVTWTQAQMRALCTDSTYRALKHEHAKADLLNDQACGYYSAVRQMRNLLAQQVAATLELSDANCF